jgi:cytochrome P450
MRAIPEPATTGGAAVTLAPTTGSDPASVARDLLRDPLSVLDSDVRRRLLANGPAVRTTAGWVVCGHSDVSRLATRAELTIDPRAGDPPLPLAQSERLDRVLGLMLNVRDGAAHARLRRLVSGAFSARRMAAMKDSVDRIVDGLVDDLLSRGSFDAVADLGAPLPALTSCAFLDLPASDWPQVATWAADLSGQIFRFGQPRARMAQVEATLSALFAYIDELARHRRGRPDDLVADLLRTAEDGTRLSREEFVAFVVQLFMNGLDTATAAVSSSVAALIRRPGLASLLATEPGLCARVFEEVIRLDSPVRMGARRATADVRLDETSIRDGDPVFLVWALANRDPRVFAAPDRFRLDRAGRHVAFGSGPHHCLGAALARLQGVAVLNRLAARTVLTGPGRGRAAGAVRQRGAALGGYITLPVRIRARARRRPGVGGAAWTAPAPMRAGVSR